MDKKSSAAKSASSVPDFPFKISWILNIYVFVLAMLPIFVVVVIALNLFSSQAKKQAINQMMALAEAKVTDIDRWVTSGKTISNLLLTNPEQYRLMNDILISRGPAGPRGARLGKYLNSQLEIQNVFEEFFLYNSNGVVRFSTDISQEGLSIKDQPYYQIGLEKSYFQPPYYNRTRGVTTAVVVQPVHNYDHQVVGGLVGRVDLTTLSAIMTNYTGLGQSGEVYLVGRDNKNFITPSRFENESNGVIIKSYGIEQGLQGVDGAGFYANYRQREVIGVYRWLPQLQCAMLAEIEGAEALGAVNNVRNTSLLISLAAAILVLIAGILFTSWFVRPIKQLTAVAKGVIDGDYSRRADVRHIAEVGTLAAVFNTMTAQLQDMINRLEQRVTERTRDLQVAMEVSRQITTELDRDELLQRVVTLTAQRFGLYSAFVFLTDDKAQKLLNAAGADSSGKLLEPGRAIREIDIQSKPGLISLAARKREVVCVNDVSQSPDYLLIPEFPATQSELVIPMIHGGKLLGVFDLQSDLKDRFDSDAQLLLTTLAEQIGIAVNNAQLFSKAQAAQQQAEIANTAKSEFLARMSHEIRTPLSAVKGLVSIVLKADLEQQQHDHLTKAQIAADNLSDLINDILDFSKVEAGKLEIYEAPFDLDQLLQQVVDLFSNRVAEKDLEINILVAKDVPHKLIGDAGRLTQVLVNLIDNSIKHTKQGKIDVRVESTAGVDNIIMTFTVSDTGAGIPKELVPHLFEPFTQEDSTLTRQHGGTGLGLAICQRLVELMGGRIEVKSSLGEGSEFVFTVCITGDTEARATPASVVPTVEKKDLALLAGKRVLLVDDNLLNIEVAKYLLEEIGLVVEIAENGSDAVNMVTVNPDSYYAAVLMDIQMPVMDGYEATRSIRKREVELSAKGQQGKTVHLPIIAITAQALKGEKSKCKAAGMDDYLAKPIDQKALNSKLIHWILPGRGEYDAALVEEPVTTKGPAVLDAEGVLKRTGIPENLYHDFLAMFNDKYIASAQEIEQFIENGKMEAAARLLHSVKGASSNIGAEILAEAAAELEGNIRENGDHTKLLSLYKSALEDAIASIAIVLKTAEPA